MVTLIGRPVGDVPEAAQLGHTADRRILLTRRATILDSGQRIYRRELGKLTLPSGQILASDPSYECFVVAPFARRVRPGRYPVVLTCVGDGENPGPHDRVAAAAILLRDELPTTWEHALCDGQKLIDLHPGQIYGYGVDGGTGCFVDAEIAGEFAAGKRNFQRLLAAYRKSDFQPLLHTFRDEPAIAVFQSGWGDGFYASYWGLDARGEPVCLVTDFGVLTVPILATLRFGEAAPLVPGRLEHPVLAAADLEIDITEVSDPQRTLELRGGVAVVSDVRLLRRDADTWTRVPTAGDLQISERAATRHLRPDVPAPNLALELELVIGSQFQPIHDDPPPPPARTPVIRRRRP